MTSKEARVLETLKKRFEKEEKIYKYKRCVYTYYDRSEKSFKDNLILLPYSTRHSHSVFLKNCLYQIYCNVSKEKSDKISDVALPIDIYFVGYYDVKKQVFEKKSNSLIVSSKEIEDILKSSRSSR